MAQSGDGDPAKADNIYGFSAIDIDGNNVRYQTTILMVSQLLFDSVLQFIFDEFSNAFLMDEK